MRVRFLEIIFDDLGKSMIDFLLTRLRSQLLRFCFVNRALMISGSVASKNGVYYA